MAGKKKKSQLPPGVKIVAVNRKARFNYELLEKYECGMSLTGTEVKSLRAGGLSLSDSYGSVDKGEIYLVGANIAPYEFGNIQNHDPLRRRKLLLHKKEIQKIAGKIAERGLTLVPTKVYFKNGKAKAQMTLAKGKKAYDKRETIKRRDQDRDLKRALKNY